MSPNSLKWIYPPNVFMHKVYLVKKKFENNVFEETQKSNSTKKTQTTKLLFSSSKIMEK